MLEVIRFLESQGRNPASSATEYQNAVSGLSIDDAQREALLGRNAHHLGDILGGRAAMRCLILTPD